MSFDYARECWARIEPLFPRDQWVTMTEVRSAVAGSVGRTTVARAIFYARDHRTIQERSTKRTRSTGGIPSSEYFLASPA